MTSGYEKLSDRERLVLELAATGLVDKEIGTEIGVSVNTLRTYWSRIRAKMGDSTRAALVASYVSEQDSLLTESCPARGWVLNVKTGMVLASDEHNRAHRLTPGVPHHRKEYQGAVHPEDESDVVRQVDRVISGEAPSVHVVFRTVFQGGTETVNMVIIGLRSADGQVEKVFGARVETHDCRPHLEPRVKIGHWTRHHPALVIEIDESLAEIVGQPGLRTIPFERLKEFLQDDQVESAVDEVEKAIKTGENRLLSSLRINLLDGTEIWARAWRELEYLDDGSVIVHGTVAVFD